VNDLALVAAPTYAGKQYALDEWIAGFNALTYEPKFAFMVDNTAVSHAYLKTIQSKGIKAIHLQPWIDKPFEYTFHRCWELICEEAKAQGAFWVYSVEADNVPAPESLEKMVSIARYGNVHLVTHDYPLHQTAAAASGMKGDEYYYTEFGCMLMTTQLLERALENFAEFKSVALAIFNSNIRYRGGHARLTHTFDVQHLDGFDMEYPQGFADLPDDSLAVCPVPYVPTDFATKLPPSLEGCAVITKET
jgi:hypothetical protein